MDSDKLRTQIEERYNISIPEGNEEDLLDDLDELVNLINKE